MRTAFRKLVRAVAATLALAVWSAPAAEAAWWATTATTRVPAAPADAPAGDPVAGGLMIAGVVALFVFMAWVAVRIGDHPSADKLPN
jgi:hypothetical protein